MKKYFILSLLTFCIACSKPVEVIQQDSPMAYVVNGGDNSISMINLTTQKIVDSLKLNKIVGEYFAHHIAISPDGTMLAVATPQVKFTDHAGLHSINTLSKKGGIIVVDRLKKRILTDIEIPAINFNAVFSPDGTEIWTTTYLSKSELFVYDAKTLALKKRIAIGGSPSELVFSKNKKYAFVALTLSSFIQVIDVATKEIIKNIKVDTFPTNVWAGENNIFVENTEAKLINVINPETLEGVSTIITTFRPGQSTEQPLQETLWVCHVGENKMSLFKKSNEKWLFSKTISLPFEPHEVQFKQDKAVVIGSLQDKLAIIDLNTMAQTVISTRKSPNGIILF